MIVGYYGKGIGLLQPKLWIYSYYYNSGIMQPFQGTIDNYFRINAT